MTTPDAILGADVVTEAIGWRHHLHRNPELAYCEHRTADFIASLLEQFGIRVDRNIAGTGLVGTLKRGNGARTIGIRADMDALPITERSGASHASSHTGVMHACGHDGHVAMLLAAARVCSRMTDLDGTVYFIFQPAEEGAGGARRMVEEGLFERFPCDAVYALHNWPALPAGTCMVQSGAVMAANAKFQIDITGRGCHGAMPHEGTDSLLAGCFLVTALQSIVSRNLDPLEGAVLSATQINAGDAWNAIGDACVIRGTTRWLSEHVGTTLEHRIKELASTVASGFGCHATVDYERLFPATVNDSAATQFLQDTIQQSGLDLKLASVPPTMGTEDFAVMLQKVPGCYFWLGTGAGSATRRLHSPLYDFNDDVLPIGAALWVTLVRRTLAISSYRG